MHGQALGLALPARSVVAAVMLAAAAVAADVRTQGIVHAGDDSYGCTGVHGRQVPLLLCAEARRHRVPVAA
jgi:hypothetical protein